MIVDGPIAFQGEPGANSAMACTDMFPDREQLPCTTFEDADFGDVKFDVIFGIHFPPHLRHDPKGTEERVERLLAPGGRVAWF